MWDVDRNRLPMWVVYNNPKDYPGHYVARLWYSIPTAEPTATVFQAPLQTIRAALSSHGYIQTARTLMDDPCIEEVWL